MTRISKPNTKIGQLVHELGWIPEEELEGILAVSLESGKPLGRILVESSYVSAEELRNLIEAQALIRDGHLSLPYAKRAIAFSSWYGVNIDNAIPWVVPGDAIGQICHSKRLGQLLVNSGCVDMNTLEHNLQVSKQVGIQLGELLVDRQHVSSHMLDVTLESQRLLRRGFVSSEQALTGLQRINQGLNRLDRPNQKIIVPLGHLLVNSGVLTRKNVDDALEVSKVNGKPLGEVLKIFAMITDGVLDSALHLQSLIHQGNIKFAGASQALSKIYETNSPLQEALASVHDISSKNADLTVAEFLLFSGLFEEKLKEIELIAQGGLPSRSQLPQLQALLGQDIVRAAVRCTFYVKRSILSCEQALVAFHLSLLTEVDIDSFLENIGWVTQSTLNKIIANSLTLSQENQSAA